MTRTYFNFPSWFLSRLAFVATHGVFTYWLLFITNDPLNLGVVNTLDPKKTLAPGQCHPIINENVQFDLGLFAAWWISHSLFARKAVKQALGLWLHPIERPLFATVAWAMWLANLVFWRPITDCGPAFNVFKVSFPVAVVSVTMFVIGTALVVGLLWSLPDHVFGTGKCRFAPGQANTKGEIIRAFPYGLVRHPAATGFLYMYWALPSYNANHIFLAALWTVFILVGTSWEESGLNTTDEFGLKYAAYKREVAAYYPTLGSLKSVIFGSSHTKGA